MPGVFSRLVPSLVTSLAVQSGFAAIFVPLQEEKYFDLAGSIGFLSTGLLSLFYPYLRQPDVPSPRLLLASVAPRQLLLTSALTLWSVRLGTFLVTRAFKAGGDKRFDDVKIKKSTFTAFWMIQGVWVFAVGLPVYMCNAVPAAVHPPLRALDYAGLTLYGVSLGLEILADWQKSSWRARKNRGEHDEKFIRSGLWGLSRHPNYVAEVGVWTGVWTLSLNALRTSYFPTGSIALAALASPVFTYFLLTKVSGVPPLEQSAEVKWKDDREWIDYKKKVPVFWPKLW